MLKKGDKVKIISGPADKLGKIGTIHSLFQNGAFVKLGKDLFVPVRFLHLEKIKNGKH